MRQWLSQIHSLPHSFIHSFTVRTQLLGAQDSVTAELGPTRGGTVARLGECLSKHA